ncbi:MAG: efflux RND transporter periplasmic adaptor subunit [Planctomycetaceae bacterium]
MTLNHHLPRVACLLMALTAGCNQHDSKDAPAKVKPAEVKSHPNEANIADIVLSQKAYERLGITTAKVEVRKISEARSLGGEVMTPPGELAIIVAPVSGTVLPSKDQPIPKPGSTVAKGQAVFQLQPLLTPERYVPTPAERAQIANAQASLISLQMTADGDVQQFQEQVVAAKIALDRAMKLLQDRVGSERDVDNAKAQLALAEAGLKVANERKTVLDKLSSNVEQGTVTPIPFDSPIDGIVRSIPVTLGQTVAAGNTLFEVVNLKSVWIRVPVYVGLLDQMKTGEPATIKFFGDNSADSAQVAVPVAAPPAADPLSSTADLYYEISNESGRFRPGERVSVSIPLQTESESPVVPLNSILYDIHGNTWVYAQSDELTFHRLRVVVLRTTDEFAVLGNTVPVDVEVVVDGAAELFGTEFGTGK